MKKIIILAIFLCFLALGAFGKETNLELKFKKDTQNIYDMKSVMTLTNIDFGGFAFPANIPPIKTEGQIFERVLDVDKDGTATVKSSLQFSTDGKEKTDPEKNYVINKVSKYGETIKVLEICNNGNVIKDSKETPLTMSSLSDLLAQKFLPGKPIEIGTAWEIDKPMSEKTPVGVKVRYILNKVEEKDGDSIAFISGDYNLNINLKDFASSLNEFIPKDVPSDMLSSLEGNAEIKINKNEQELSLTKGLLLKSLMEGETVINMIEPDTGMPITVNLALNVNMNFKEAKDIKDEPVLVSDTNLAE